MIMVRFKMPEDEQNKVDENYLSSLIRSKTAFRYGDSFLSDGLEYQYSFALVMFDSSLEIMISTSLSYLQNFPGEKEKSSRDFMSLATRLNKKFKDQTPMNEDELKNLHDARNNAQHHNITPSKIDLERYRATTLRSLKLICANVFSIDFEKISRAILIKDKFIQELYESAEDDYLKQNYEDCIIKCGAAFQIARMKEKLKLYGSFRALDEIVFEFNKEKRGPELEDIYEIISKITEELEILELGLDYKRYQIFNELFNYQINEWTPGFNITEEGPVSKAFDSLKKFLKENKSNLRDDHDKEKADFSLLFVIDPILRWESVDRETVLDLIGKIIQAFTKGQSNNKKKN